MPKRHCSFDANAHTISNAVHYICLRGVIQGHNQQIFSGAQNDCKLLLYLTTKYFV